MNLAKHPLNLFPPASDDDLDSIVADIRSNGFDPERPVVLFEGSVIDGWNRVLACKHLGVQPATRVFNGTYEQALEFTFSTNRRRNLSSSQRAAIAVEATEVLARIKAEAKERQLAALKQNAGTVRQLIAEGSSDDNKASARAAVLFGTNRQYINDAAKLKNEDPQLFISVKSGSVSLTQARRERKEKKRQQRRDNNHDKVSRAISPQLAVSAGARFATVVIDPPWDWGDEGDQDQLGRARPTYATMSIEQILALPVSDLSDVDCHLYLWITNRSLPKGFQLLENWGFRYVTALTWVKPSFGMGNYFRGQTEHVLFGVRGSQPLKRRDVGTAFNAPRGNQGHSSKPEAFYSLVESCSPGPYLEMFSRCTRDGWTAWGEDARAVA